MKILQLNIWGGKLGRPISNLLQREQADVVCLQEVISIAGAQSFFFEDLDELQQNAGYEYVYKTPSYDFNLMKRRASWGNAIMSRVPFKTTSSLYTYSQRVENFDFLENSDYNTGRSLQHVTVVTDFGELNILNHHGYHINGHKNGNDETLRQCGMIAEYVRNLDGEVVLCGDFNLLPDSPSVNLINDVLVNHVKEQGIVTTRTPLTYKTEPCDFIFTSPNLSVTNFRVLDDIVSDHKALIIEF